MQKSISFLLFTVLVLSCTTKKQLLSSSQYVEEIAHHRTEYQADFIKDERAPLEEADLKHMHFYKADENYKCNCDFELTPKTKPFELSTYSGITKPFRQYGIATCMINSKKTKVHIYASLRVQAMPGYKDHLFLPFKDHTSGYDTYGGGRYIDLKTGDIQNGKIELDFNKCYNPWCAYSDGYNCPIPPIENHFDIPVYAGEKMWTGKKKKG